MSAKTKPASYSIETPNGFDGFVIVHTKTKRIMASFPCKPPIGGQREAYRDYMTKAQAEQVAGAVLVLFNTKSTIK